MDVIDLEILDNGALKIDCGPVSGPNHMSAEAFIRECSQTMGGKVDQKRKGHGHHHHHKHEHDHHHH